MTTPIDPTFFEHHHLGLVQLRRELHRHPELGFQEHETAKRICAELNFLNEFREMFGDERADYGEALKHHYNEGPPEDWRTRFVSTYASAHPHEDWAETVSHLLHLTDITDSFVSSGLDSPELPRDPKWDAYAEPDAEHLIDIATALIAGVNHVNRAMGLPDVYPFLLSEVTLQKLSFVHGWLRRGAQGL